MGIDYCVYVGPFVKAKLVKGEVMRSCDHGCPNEHCEQYAKHNEAKYCSKCGSKNSKFGLKGKGYVPLHSNPQTEKLEIELEADLGRIFDYLLPMRTMCEINREVYPYECYTPNRDIAGIDRPLGFDPRYTDTLIEEYDDALIRREKEAFRETFTDQIDVLNKWYGAENVTIVWGLLSMAG